MDAIVEAAAWGFSLAFVGFAVVGVVVVGVQFVKAYMQAGRELSANQTHHNRTPNSTHKPNF